MKLFTLLRHKVVQGTLWYSLVGLLTSSMSVILLPVMTRWMPPVEFGVLNSALALSQLLFPFVTVGLGAALVRYLHTYKEEPERFRRFFNAAFWFQVVMVLIVSTLLLTFVGLKGDVAGVELALLVPVLLLLVLNPPRDIGNHLLTAEENHGKASWNQLVSFIIATGLSLWLIGAIDMGATGRLYGRVAGAAAAAVMILKLPEVFSKIHFSIDWGELKVGLKFGLPYIPYAFAMAFMLSGDRLLLQHYVEMESVGVYSAAKTVAMGMTFVFVAVTRAWYPRYFALRESEDYSAVLRGQWAVLCLLAVTASGFVVLAPVVFPLMVDSRYWEGDSLLPTLALAMYGYGLFLTQANYISYLKKTMYLPLIAGVGVLVNVSLSVWLIPTNGMAGAALALTVGYLAMNLSLFTVSLKMEKRILERFVLPMASIVLTLGGVAVASAIPENYSWVGRCFLAACFTLVLAVAYMGGGKLLSLRKEGL